MFSVVFISNGLDVQTDWTYSVLESWRIDKDASMEINVQNRGPSLTIPQRENKQSSEE